VATPFIHNKQTKIPKSIKDRRDAALRSRGCDSFDLKKIQNWPGQPDDPVKTRILDRVDHWTGFKNFDIKIFLIIESSAYKLGLLTTMAMPCKHVSFKSLKHNLHLNT
jgi:hypothetical protein